MITALGVWALRRQQKLSRISDGYQAMMRERNQALLAAKRNGRDRCLTAAR